MDTAVAQKREQDNFVKRASQITPDIQRREEAESRAASGVPLFLRASKTSNEIPEIQRQVEVEEEEELLQSKLNVQTKLTVGAPGDEYERQADAVADKVMRMPVGGGELEGAAEDSPIIQTKSLDFPIQRLCADCEEALGGAGAGAVQAKSAGVFSSPSLANSVKNTISSPGNGSSLNNFVRSRVEPVLGADLSSVRVHSGASAQDASQRLNAKAFTHQNNIFLGKGQSASDVQLMAHEATHVVQQGGGKAVSDSGESSVVAPVSPAAGSVVQRRDLHQGAAVPDASGQQAITAAMNPQATVSSGGTVTIRTWGGRTGGAASPTPAQQRVRNQTLQALRRGIYRALNRALSWIRPMARRYAAQRIPTADLQGAGNAAADLVRSHVGGYIKHSVGGVARLRHGFIAGANLLDAYDTADRATAGEPISAEAVVEWALRNTPAATARSTFAFNPDNTEEDVWLTNTAIAQIIGARRADFELWDRFGFAMVGRLGNRTLATTMAPTGFSARAPSGGGLSPAHRAARWSAFAELMHEYFHLVEHPAHIHARQNSALNSALNEGVTDVLTEDTYNAKVASVRSDASVIAKVEGAPPPAGTVVPRAYLPASYQIAYPTEVADVRSALGAVNLDGFKAAYLTGHVEYEGLEPSGNDRPPVAAGTGQGIDIPASVTTLAELAHSSGNTQMAIWSANLGVTSWSPLPRRLNVPGWREHIVVATPAGVTESLPQIARQRDVSVADLNAHNRHHPGWPVLTAGMKVLIPPRGFRP